MVGRSGIGGVESGAKGRGSAIGLGLAAVAMFTGVALVATLSPTVAEGKTVAAPARSFVVHGKRKTTTTPPPTSTTTVTATTTPVTTTTAAPTTTTAPPTTTTGAATMIFSDEFNGTSLDTNMWYRCYKWTNESDGCSNNPGKELEWYQTGNVSESGGMLNLTAKAESVKDGYPYTSGIVTTGGSPTKAPTFQFKYGYAEARVKIPPGAGMWPAFWLVNGGSDWLPEIDIMEWQGVLPTLDIVHLHWRDSSGAVNQTGLDYDTGIDLSGGFHTFAVDWQPDHLSYYFDGKEIKRITDTGIIPATPLYVLLNLAVGGWKSGQLTPDPAAFPGTYQVDYVRIWNKKP